MIDDIWDSFKWGLKHARDGVERTLAPSEFRTVTDRVSVPPSVETPNQGVYLGTESGVKNEYFAVKRGPRRPQFYPVFDSSDATQSVSVSSSENFTGIDTQIVDVQNTDTVNLSATFTHPDGGTTNDSIRYNLQDYSLHDGRVLPLHLSAPRPATEATVTLETDHHDTRPIVSRLLPEKFRKHEWKPDQSPRLSVPAPRGQNGTPIFLISVDTFRYDALEAFAPVLEALGSDAIIPSEPRTQGHWTRPAHASMFTGVHPSTHKYVGFASEEEGQYGLPAELTTLPELLSNSSYKCSGCVPRSKTGVEYGFGRGMHRYKYNPISWADPDYDGADTIDQAIRWISADQRTQGNRLFYFLHLFDPHYPYVPTVFSDVSPIDFDLIERFESKMGVDDYLEALDQPASMSDTDVDLIKSYYYRAVRYAAEQIVRLVCHLKQVGLYEDSLLIITGDHGEDFFEREFAGHQSVTDANIRPGMVIKPPAGVDFRVPDTPDIIDFLPTIAELIDEDVPAQSEGVAWQRKSDTPRITERVRSDWYTISVEVESIKGVYTYQENYPSQPTEAQLTDGPVDVRFFNTTSRRPGEPLDRADPSDSLRDEIERVIENHIADANPTQPIENGRVKVSEDAKERLRKLGYK
ncbi:sulfatase-like hydrolase/transferase [Halorubrum sp. SY-15]|uniref:sulfatase-like hydrolase/transferase n=1 Tax=Halorubrum sp. SY-15 TaxID=3402277 RepID=UPI003EBD7DAA